MVYEKKKGVASIAGAVFSGMLVALLCGVGVLAYRHYVYGYLETPSDGFPAVSVDNYGILKREVALAMPEARFFSISPYIEETQFHYQVKVTPGRKSEQRVAGYEIYDEKTNKTARDSMLSGLRLSCMIGDGSTTANEIQEEFAPYDIRNGVQVNFCQSERVVLDKDVDLTGIALTRGGLSVGDVYGEYCFEFFIDGCNYSVTGAYGVPAGATDIASTIVREEVKAETYALVCSVIDQ